MDAPDRIQHVGMSSTSKWEPMCQSITGPPVDEAIGTLIAEQTTPAVVELALEVSRGIQAGHEEADRLRYRRSNAHKRKPISLSGASCLSILAPPQSMVVEKPGNAPIGVSGSA